MSTGRVRSALLGAVCAAALVSLTPALAEQPATNSNGGSGHNLTAKAETAPTIPLPSLAPLAHAVLPAVVNISVELNEQASLQGEGETGSSSPFGPGGTPFDQFLHRFFQGPLAPTVPNEKIMALGSGFVIDPSGYIVTNNHVVAHAEKVTVIFQDGSREQAKVIGRDARTDLALIKIRTNKTLPYVTWGDSNDVHVGDWVMAVGNPFGLGGTVTAGIVSALGRNIGEGPYDDFIQIDAPINRGNSGGPSFDLKGRVIGINTAIYSPSGGSVGIGFAIPSSTAKYVIGQLKAHGHVTWGWLGVAIQNMTPTIAKSLGLNSQEPQGALIASVIPDSPAAKAGLQSGDVIIKANGHDIKSVHDLPRIVAESPVGSKLTLEVVRNGNNKTLTATVGEMPRSQQEASAEETPESSRAPASTLGLQLEPLTRELRQDLHVPKDVNGVVVAHVAGDSPAMALGIRPGDVIVSVDQKPVTSPQQAAKQLKEAARRGNVLLLLNRHGTNEFVGLSVQGNGTAGSSRGG
ncbi:MAG TPA: DegQ family serine endoprotease [Stellaceae bacterium]|nr:DegQ family serine endoprotease [Stellaceae bacterium]